MVKSKRTKREEGDIKEAREVEVIGDWLEHTGSHNLLEGRLEGTDTDTNTYTN